MAADFQESDMYFTQKEMVNGQWYKMEIKQTSLKILRVNISQTLKMFTIVLWCFMAGDPNDTRNPPK